MKQEIIIWSLLRKPVDLAAELRDWPEFVEGESYSVDFEDKKTDEIVTVRYIEDWDGDYLSIESTAPGTLFDRVVGRVIRVLSMQSGYLKVRRFPADQKLLFTPRFK